MRARARRAAHDALSFLAHPRLHLELRRLESMPRGEAGTERLTGRSLRFVDGPSFAAQYREIYLRGAYDLPAELRAPRIIDAGANVGTAVSRWLTTHPDVRATAYEADTAIAQVLRENVARIGATDQVDVVAAAVWVDDEPVLFTTDGTDTGRIAGEHEEASGAAVQGVSLARLLQSETHVDLLKLDIEGAETDVLLSAEAQLTRCARLFVEYHSWLDTPQRLDELLACLRRSGFRVQIHDEFVSGRPFLEYPLDSAMDLRLNIFALRA